MSFTRHSSVAGHPGCSPFSVIVKNNNDGLFSASLCTVLEGDGWREFYAYFLSRNRLLLQKCICSGLWSTQPQAGTACTHSSLMPSLKPRAELWAPLCASRWQGPAEGMVTTGEGGRVRVHQGMSGRLAHCNGDYSHQNREFVPNMCISEGV